MYKLLESVVTLCCFQECAFSTFGLYQNSANSSHFWSSTLCLSSHTCLCHHFVFTSLSSPSYSLHISICVIFLSSHICLRHHFTDFESSRLQSKPIKRERWGDEERGKGGLEGGLDGGGLVRGLVGQIERKRQDFVAQEEKSRSLASRSTSLSSRHSLDCRNKPQCTNMVLFFLQKLLLISSLLTFLDQTTESIEATWCHALHSCWQLIWPPACTGPCTFTEPYTELWSSLCPISPPR